MENNKLIAEFMGVEIVKRNGEHACIVLKTQHIRNTLGAPSTTLMKVTGTC